MAKQPRASTAKPRKRRAAPAQLAQQTAGDSDALLAIHQKLDQARIAFARLASLRAADMVLYQGKSWDDGANYINMEVQSLDQHLGIAQ